MSNFWNRVRFRRDHRWTPGHMSEYLDEELAARARSRLERHAHECAECRGVLGGLRRMLGALQQLPPSSTGAEVAQIVAAVRVRLREPPAR